MRRWASCPWGRSVRRCVPNHQPLMELSIAGCPRRERGARCCVGKAVICGHRRASSFKGGIFAHFRRLPSAVARLFPQALLLSYCRPGETPESPCSFGRFAEGNARKPSKMSRMRRRKVRDGQLAFVRDVAFGVSPPQRRFACTMAGLEREGPCVFLAGNEAGVEGRRLELGKRGRELRAWIWGAGVTSRKARARDESLDPEPELGN